MASLLMEDAHMPSIASDGPRVLTFGQESTEKEEQEKGVLLSPVRKLLYQVEVHSSILLEYIP